MTTQGQTFSKAPEFDRALDELAVDYQLIADLERLTALLRSRVPKRLDLAHSYHPLSSRRLAAQAKAALPLTRDAA